MIPGVGGIQHDSQGNDVKLDVALDLIPVSPCLNSKITERLEVTNSLKRKATDRKPQLPR